MNNNDPFRDKVEAYALGTLEEAERSELEAHLTSGCATCQRALAEGRWLVAQLGYLAEEATPPGELKNRLLARVRAEAATTQFPSPGSSGSRRIPWWMWGAVAALLLLTLYSTWVARELETKVRESNRRADEVIRERERLLQERDTLRREAAILMSPSSARIMLIPEHGDMPTLEASWHPQLGLCVTGHQVPMPAKNHVLQLWLIPKDPGKKPMPSITFWPEQNGKLAEIEMHPPQPMDNVKALAVTEEPMGGSPQPTSTPMWVGSVS